MMRKTKMSRLFLPVLVFLVTFSKSQTFETHRNATRGIHVGNELNLGGNATRGINFESELNLGGNATRGINFESELNLGGNATRGINFESELNLGGNATRGINFENEINPGRNASRGIHVGNELNLGGNATLGIHVENNVSSGTHASNADNVNHKNIENHGHHRQPENIGSNLTLVSNANHKNHKNYGRPENHAHQVNSVIQTTNASKIKHENQENYGRPDKYDSHIRTAMKRLIYTTSLVKYFPKKPDMDYDVNLVRTSVSPNFTQKYTFVIENDKIYFLTADPRPANLTINIYLNSTMNPKNDVIRIRKNFLLKDGNLKRSNFFILSVRNPIHEILEQEVKLLEIFERKLWPTKKPCKDCLSIVSIRPFNDTYKVLIGSTEGHSDLLQEFCFLERIPEKYLKTINLQIDYSDISCDTKNLEHKKSPMNHYKINALINVGLKPINLNKIYRVPASITYGGY